jgi:hypothetical protein
MTHREQVSALRKWRARGQAGGLMRYSGLAIGFVLVTCAAFGANTDGGWKPLWNGKDLTGWSVWLSKPHASVVIDGIPKDDKGAYARPIGAHDPLGVFTVAKNVDGQPAIRVSGQVFGELRSKESFTNYHLRLQFKWGQKKWPPREKPATQRDSGLLYHVHGPEGEGGRVWARSIELQIQERDVGDLYAIMSEIAVRSTQRPGTQIFDYNPKGEWHTFSQVPGSDGRCVKQPDNEKPTGEWNTVELVCLGDDSIHIVNGKVVMRLHGPLRIDRTPHEPVTSGPVILQSEGAEIFYRDIEWRPIKAIPVEFADK